MRTWSRRGGVRREHRSRCGGGEHERPYLDPLRSARAGGRVRLAQPAPAQEHGKRVDHFSSSRPTALHMLADAGDRLAQPSFHAAERDPQALGNLAVREVAEIRELDQLPLARGQRADRLADRLAHHRAGESPPAAVWIDAFAHPLDEHPFETFMSPPNTPPVDRTLSDPGHEPGTPGAAGGCRDRALTP